MLSYVGLPANFTDTLFVECTIAGAQAEKTKGLTNEFIVGGGLKEAEDIVLGLHCDVGAWLEVPDGLPVPRLGLSIRPKQENTKYGRSQIGRASCRERV